MVTITGTGFSEATQVLFENPYAHDPVPATSFTIDSNRKIEAVSPPNYKDAWAYVRVVTPGGTSSTESETTNEVDERDQFSYLEAPRIDRIKPSTGPTTGGKKVTISLTFSCASPPTEVDFGDVPSPHVEVAKSGALVAISPPEEAGTVDVTVASSACGRSVPVAQDRYTYTGAPTVTGVSPSHGSVAGGTSVIVSGTGFALGSATSFKFGKVAATSVDCTSKTSCTVEAPPAKKGKAAAVDVVADTGKPSEKTTADEFTYE